MVHQLQHVAEGVRVPRHLQADVVALGEPQFVPCDLVQILVHDVHGTRDAHLSGEVELVVVHVRDDNAPSADMLGQSGSHDPDGTSARDEYVLAHEVEGECGVRRVPEGVQYRGHLVGDAFGDRENVHRRDAQVFCERALAIHADADGVAAKVSDSRAAIAAMPAHDVALATHAVTLLEALDVWAHVHHDARELMPDGHAPRDRLLRPLVPVVDVHVRAADRCALHLDQDIVISRLRHLLLVHPNAAFPLQLRQRAHLHPRELAAAVGNFGGV
mmetsp:Transcript_19346/g.53121  ORF Transcript_19346/g.53121 Transcript_19346/m.53121 type:complete len:273 (-) Transcript_19346:175-993(-)